MQAARALTFVAILAAASPIAAQEVSAFGAAGSSSINGLGDHYGGGLAIAMFLRGETDGHATKKSRGRVGLRAAFSLLTSNPSIPVFSPPPCPPSCELQLQDRGPRRIVAQQVALILRSPDTHDFRLDLGLGPNFYAVQGARGVGWGLLLTGGVALRVIGPTWLSVGYDFHGEPGGDAGVARRPYATHMLRAGLSVDLRK